MSAKIRALIKQIQQSTNEGLAIVEDALDRVKQPPKELAKRANQMVKLGDQMGRSSEAYYSEAGRFLFHLKESKPNGISWPVYLDECEVDFGRSRADELIAIYEGRKTVGIVRIEWAERQRNKRSAVSHGGADTENIDETGDEQADFEAEIEPQHRRVAFLLRADQAAAMAVYSGPITQEILDAARFAAQRWNQLVRQMQREIAGGKA